MNARQENAIGTEQEMHNVSQASNDQQTRQIKSRNLTAVRCFTGHKGFVSALALAPDGRRAVSSGDDYLLRLWDVQSCREISSLEYRQDLQCMDQRFKTAGEWWESDESDPFLRKMFTTRQPVDMKANHLAISPNGRLAISRDNDGLNRLWNLDTAKAIHCWLVDPHPDSLIGFLPDSRQIRCGRFGRIVVDAETGARLRELLLPDESLSASGEPLAGRTEWVSNNGRLALCRVNGEEGEFSLWDLRSAPPIKVKHFSLPFRVRCICLSQDSQYGIAVAVSESEIEVEEPAQNVDWNYFYQNHADKGSSQETIEAEEAALRSKTRKVKRKVERDHCFFYDLSTQRVTFLQNGGFHRSQFCPRNRRVVTQRGDEPFKVWDCQSPDNVLVLSDADETPLTSDSYSTCHCSWSGSGRFLLGGASNRAVRLWQLPEN